MKHFFRVAHYEIEGSWYLHLGPVVASFYLLAGRWISLGIHLSIVPLYVDFHLLWLTITVMSRERASELRGDEEAYLFATSQK